MVNEEMIKFIRATKFSYEDIAKGAGISAAVLKTWMQSPLDEKKTAVIKDGIAVCVEREEKFKNVVAMIDGSESGGNGNE